MSQLPAIDARQQDSITEQQARFFLDNGLLLIRNLINHAELTALQQQTQVLVDRAVQGIPEVAPADDWTDEHDVHYRRHSVTGKITPYRIEYVIDKTAANKALLGHPFILRSIEKIQGRNFLPTWDSMVFKRQGMGALIPWHRDGQPYDQSRLTIDPTAAAVNVDFYLDGSDMTNCLWAIPGSNRWPHDQALARIAQLNSSKEFSTDGAVPLPVQPGDVLFHSTLALHGSPAAQSQLRRVVYYEFRPIEVEATIGPHTPQYIPLKQKVLLSCLRQRRAADYAGGETPFEYKPDAKWAPPADDGQALSGYRFHHADYWRVA